MDGSKVDHTLSITRGGFIVFTESPGFFKPAVCSLHDPALGFQDESFSCMLHDLVLIRSYFENRKGLLLSYRLGCETKLSGGQTRENSQTLGCTVPQSGLQPVEHETSWQRESDSHLEDTQWAAPHLCVPAVRGTMLGNTADRLLCSAHGRGASHYRA
jgi:hypothetical protein